MLKDQMKKRPQHSNGLRQLSTLTLAESLVIFVPGSGFRKKWNIGRCCCGTPAFTVVASNILVRTQYDMSGDVQQLFGHHAHITAAIKELIRKHARSVKA